MDQTIGGNNGVNDPPRRRRKRQGTDINIIIEGFLKEAYCDNLYMSGSIRAGSCDLQILDYTDDVAEWILRYSYFNEEAVKNNVIQTNANIDTILATNTAFMNSGLGVTSGIISKCIC